METCSNSMNKIFFDFEFTGLHQNTTPISFGAVTEKNKSFYYAFTDYDKSQIDEWIESNVIKNLYLDKDTKCDFYAFGTKDKFKRLFLDFLKETPGIYEFYGDVLSYDWILLNSLLATYYNSYPKLPEEIYYIPFDISTIMKIKDIDPDISREELSGIKYNQHNALEDAIIIKLCYEKIINK